MSALELDPAPRVSAVDEAARAVRLGLESARETLQAAGIRVPTLQGKLLRPMVAYALVHPARRADLDEGFWLGALAVQMVHEASLLHDDILDEAPCRRGVDTTATSQGVGSALVLGDLYLTGAYRAAAAAGRPLFLHRFILGVERTVAGEAAQGRSAGARLTPDAYESVVRGKSGALFGAAAVLGVGAVSTDTPPSAVAARIELGEQLGATYQRIDDLLDYCTQTDSGKPALQDYRQGKWTWVLDLVEGLDGFGQDEAEVVRRLFTPDQTGAAPAAAAIQALERQANELVARLAEVAPGDSIVPELLAGWLSHATRAVRAQTTAGPAGSRRDPVVIGRAEGPAAADEVRRFALELGDESRWLEYFGRHARTFRLATRLFPAEPARTVTGVYAFCRFTDDLVDEPRGNPGPDRVRARLEAWRALTEAAWEGDETGVPLLDRVIGGAERAGVSRRYPMALLDGVAMDLERTTYRDWTDLERYTFGVAGAVGGWLTQGFGIHDEGLLECAHALGHAMQLTNIARDVGEDWERGRIYVPLDLLEAHGLEPAAFGTLVRRGAAVPGAYVGVVEAVLARADGHYARAWPGIRALPGWYRRPVAAAAASYRGIHDEIRRNGHDNFGRRAHTSKPRKLWLSAVGMVRALHGTTRPTAGPKEVTG